MEVAKPQPQLKFEMYWFRCQYLMWLSQSTSNLSRSLMEETPLPSNVMSVHFEFSHF